MTFGRVEPPTRARVDVTARAARAIRSLLPRNPNGRGFALRITVEPDDPAGPDLTVALKLTALSGPEDVVLSCDGFDVVADRRTIGTIDGLRVDYIDSGVLAGFLLTGRPPAPTAADLPASGISGSPFGPAELVARVAAAIAVRPLLRADGGDVTLVGVREDTAYVRLSGACRGCSAADRTMTPVLEYAVRAGVPEIARTILVP